MLGTQRRQRRQWAIQAALSSSGKMLGGLMESGRTMVHCYNGVGYNMVEWYTVQGRVQYGRPVSMVDRSTMLRALHHQLRAGTVIFHLPLPAFIKRSRRLCLFVDIVGRGPMSPLYFLSFPEAVLLALEGAKCFLWPPVATQSYCALQGDSSFISYQEPLHLSFYLIT